MADRTSAGLFGDIFILLTDFKNKPESIANIEEIALKIYLKSKDYDFSCYQMECDAALLELGLAKMVDGEIVYLNGW